MPDITRDDVTEYALARYVNKHYGTVRHTETYGWLEYNQAYWSGIGADVAAFNQVSEGLMKRQAEVRRKGKFEADHVISQLCENSVRNINAVLTHLKNMTSTPLDQFDASPDELNVANGVVNLETGEVIAHQPSQLFTYCVDVPYLPGADSSVWEEFLARSVGGGPEIVDFLQRCVGYSLTGHTHEEKMFYIYGPTRSGKGVFTETLLALLGATLATEVDFNIFTRERQQDANNFDLAPLKAARFLAASESSRYQRLNEAKVKQMTGGNSIWCAFKYSKHFSYRPQYKIWLTSNYEVNADPNDLAVWGRLVRLEFPVSHLGEEDVSLKARLRQPEHLAGVLRWAVEGARRWYVEGLEIPAALQAHLAATRDELDTVQHWLEESTLPDATSFLSNDTIRSSYQEWCEAQGFKPMNGMHLSRTITTKGAYTIHKKSGRRGIVGLRLRLGVA